MRWWPALALLVCGCNRESRARHEELARAMKAPVAFLCETRHSEGGGCYADCQTRLSAKEGRAAVEASAAFMAVPRVDDVETEKLLADVRLHASELHAVLARECPTSVPSDVPITPEVTRCADEMRKNGVRLSKLFDAVDTLGKHVEERVGTKLPSLGDCPRS